MKCITVTCQTCNCTAVSYQTKAIDFFVSHYLLPRATLAKVGPALLTGSAARGRSIGAEYNLTVLEEQAEQLVQAGYRLRQQLTGKWI